MFLTYVHLSEILSRRSTLSRFLSKIFLKLYNSVQLLIRREKEKHETADQCSNPVYVLCPANDYDLFHYMSQ